MAGVTIRSFGRQEFSHGDGEKKVVIQDGVFFEEKEFVCGRPFLVIRRVGVERWIASVRSQ
jgi:hypothetical protein